jgi:hypothetical protein
MWCVCVGVCVVCVCMCGCVFVKGKLIRNVSRLAVYEDITLIYIYVCVCVCVCVHIYHLNTDTARDAISQPQLRK